MTDKTPDHQVILDGPNREGLKRAVEFLAAMDAKLDKLELDVAEMKANSDKVAQELVAAAREARKSALEAVMIVAAIERRVTKVEEDTTFDSNDLH